MNVMNRISWLALAALAAALLAVGCSSDYETEANDEGAPAIETGQSTSTYGDSAAASTAMALASNAYTNEDGVAVCPVMGNPIPDVRYATGVREYEGKTYYFC